jgi:limonene-1,2-epoxide hydrolase
MLRILLALFCTFALAAPCSADTDAQKLATVERMIQAWNERNWEQVYDLFAEDGVLHSMMLPPVVGREAIKKRIGALAADISRIELRIRHLGVVGNVVFVERVDDFVYRGHHGAVPVVGVVEVENGRVKVWREYYDRAQMIEAMGLKQDFDDTQRR